ncbi:MAG TPA: glycosyltransferase [Acidimicrobiales bacterium]
MSVRVPPVISVIVPVRNGMPWLEEQLRALDAQVCDEPWEVVVADNGSTDGSLAFARDWAVGHPGVLVVDASGMRGTSAARNAGVEVSHGEFLAFCDADDVVLSGWLSGMVETLRTADLAAGRFDFWSLNTIPPAAPVRAATRQLGFLPAGLGANLAVRRAPFEEVGGFDEYFVPGEDIDLCWRLQLRGFTFAEAPRAVVSKRARSDFRSVFRQAYAYGQCGPLLHKRYRRAGAKRDLRGALKAWVWLVVSLPRVAQPTRRIEWARGAGTRLGRLEASLRLHVFFP